MSFKNNLTASDTVPSSDLLESPISLLSIRQLAYILVTGEDAQRFLQGQLTCDIPPPESSVLTLGAHCSTKGKVHNFFRIIPASTCFKSSGYLLICHPETLEISVTKLKKYAMFSKVSIDAVNEQLSAFGLYGSEAPQFVKQRFSNSNLEINQIASLDQHVVVRLRGQKPRYLVLGQSSLVQNIESDCAKSLSKPILEPKFWTLTDIKAGIPTIYASTIDQFFPHYLNLPTLNAVSFEKGCYLGQEVIARMQYRGKVNKHLRMGLVTESKEIPVPGDKILHKVGSETHEAGHVVSVAPISQFCYELLAVIKDDYQDFRNLMLDSADEPILHQLNLGYA